MDTPKGRTSLLESFPPDIWAYFARYLPGEQLMRLMMTGATLLRRRLKSPSVVKSIKVGEDFIIFKSFPRFLKELPSVEELSIMSYNSEWSLALGLRIESIPSGVRKLELIGDWNESADTLFGEGGAMLKLDEHLPKLESLDVEWLGMGNYAWMKHAPQSLTRMKINFWDGAVALPSTLLHFEVVRVLASATSIVSSLPMLESFVVLYEFHSADSVLALLPASLRQLSLGTSVLMVSDLDSTVRRDDENSLRLLPSSLTQLQIADGFAHFESHPQWVSLLPSTLTELNCSQVLPCSAWPLLPPQLQYLTFMTHSGMCTEVTGSVFKNGIHHQITTYPFNKLPRSLTSLVLDSDPKDHSFCGAPATSDQSSDQFDMVISNSNQSDQSDQSDQSSKKKSTPSYSATSSHQSYFPPHLTYLSLPGIQLSSGAAQHLPPSLTHLEIGNLSDQICEHLPSGIQTLVSNRTWVSPKLIKHLPKSLTSLQLAYSDITWFDYQTGSPIDTLSKIEEYAIHQNCISKSFDWKDSSLLPPQLTSLSLSQFDELGDLFLFPQPLAKLQTLHMGEAKWVTDISIPLLSPQLTSLNLACASTVSGKSFPSLPRCLIYLTLNSSESIFDSDIQHLPRTLICAFFQQAIHLTDLCIPDLPPHLERLDIRSNEKISPSSFPYFPYSIRTCCRPAESAQFSKWSILHGRVVLESQ